MQISFTEIGNGKPVVLLHAFPLSGKMWQSQAEMLARNGFRVILPDFPGFGENFNCSKRFSLEETALQISRLIDSLKIEKAIVGGLSMGGYVLFDLIRLAPEKISALIFCDTTFNADTEEKRNARFELISKIERDGSRALVENMLCNLISDYTRQNNQNLVEELRKTFLEVSPVSAVNALRSMAERIDNAAAVEHISVPALLLFGEFDRITNLDNARNLEALIPNSQLIIIENAGHYSNLEQPARFNEPLLNFCNQIKY
ncbi:MAG TPA: alpha/beta hydrolase [Pyrinomonadaceae bacterium]|jgi:pimeloyl-ACP methyl ester carboxylesterase